MAAVTPSKGFKIIRGEHRAIAAVLHCLEHVLKDVRDGAIEPPFEVFESLLRYLDEFPDRFHHPKEDDHLFPALANRNPASLEVIHQLQRQHEDGYRMTAELGTALAAWKAGEDGGFEAFEALARDFIAFQGEHIRLEETKILPVARDTLSEDDWKAIDQAFSENEDPIFGDNPKAEFDKLFSKIVTTAPAPWGLGARTGSKRRTLLEKIGVIRS